MNVVVRSGAAGANVALAEADDFRSFQLVADAASAVELADALGDAGWVEETSGDAFLWIAAVLRLAGSRALEPRWRSEFDAMVDYARARGWLDVGGEAIRAHVEVDQATAT